MRHTYVKPSVQIVKSLGAVEPQESLVWARCSTL